jgi:hypothetical protein
MVLPGRRHTGHRKYCSDQKQRAGRQPKRALSGQENLAGWHASRQVVRKAEAFSQAGRQAGIVESKQERHTEMQEPRQEGTSWLAETGRNRLASSSRQRPTGDSRQAGRGQGDSQTGRENQKQISLMMAVYEAKHVGDNVI